MATLSPSNLETADYGTSGWNNIYSSNFQKLNDYLAKFEDLWNSTPDNWSILRYDSSTSKWIKDTIANLSTQLESSLAKVDLSNVDDNTILTKLKNVDGSGSGLDSDTVDGHHADISPAPLTIPVANSSGYINDWINQGEGSGLDADTVDNFHASDFVPVSSDSDISISISGTQVFNISTAGILTLPKQSFIHVYMNNGGTNYPISANTWTKVPLDIVINDTQNEFDTTNHRFTASETGVYFISAVVNIANPTDQGNYRITVYKNGVSWTWWRFLGASGTRYQSLIYPIAIKLSAGDYIEVFVRGDYDFEIAYGEGNTLLFIAKIA